MIICGLYINYVCSTLDELYIAKLIVLTYTTPFVKCNYFHVSQLSVVFVLEDAKSYKRSFSPWPSLDCIRLINQTPYRDRLNTYQLRTTKL